MSHCIKCPWQFVFLQELLNVLCICSRYSNTKNSLAFDVNIDFILLLHFRFYFLLLLRKKFISLILKPLLRCWFSGIYNSVNLFSSINLLSRMGFYGKEILWLYMHVHNFFILEWILLFVQLMYYNVAQNRWFPVDLCKKLLTFC